MTTRTARTTSTSVGETQRLAGALAELLAPGDVVCLYGQLGAGKTYFTKGLVAGLDGDADAVTSPTFVLLQVYEARMPVYHFDAYRLRSGRDLVDIGSDEILAGDGVSVIEWADRVADALPRDRLEVHLGALGGDARRLVLRGAGPRAARCVDRLAERGLVAGDARAGD
jgi:tRNA threonylcarbamoyladenosine biosynthesis protein TsaE